MIRSRLLAGAAVAGLLAIPALPASAADRTTVVAHETCLRIGANFLQVNAQGGLDAAGVACDDAATFTIHDLGAGGLVFGDAVALEASDGRFVGIVNNRVGLIEAAIGSGGEIDPSARLTLTHRFGVAVPPVETAYLTFQLPNGQYVSAKAGAWVKSNTRLGGWESLYHDVTDVRAYDLSVARETRDAPSHRACLGRDGLFLKETASGLEASAEACANLARLELVDVNGGELSFGDAVYVRSANGSWLEASAEGAHRFAANLTEADGRVPDSRRFEIVGRFDPEGPVAGEIALRRFDGLNLSVVAGGALTASTALSTNETFDLVIVESRTTKVPPSGLSLTGYPTCLGAGAFFVQVGETGVLDAKAPACADAARFDIVDADGGDLALGDTVFLRTHDGRWVRQIDNLTWGVTEAPLDATGNPATGAGFTLASRFETEGSALGLPILSFRSDTGRYMSVKAGDWVRGNTVLGGWEALKVALGAPADVFAPFGAADVADPEPNPDPEPVGPTIGFDPAAVPPIVTAEGATATPRWFSGVEAGFPAPEWSGTFGAYAHAPDRVTQEGQKAGWRFIDADAIGVAAPEGEHVYEGWIDGPNPAGNHGAYPLIHLKTPQGPADQFTRAEIPHAPTVISWFAWTDYDFSNFTTNTDWVHWATLGCQAGRWEVMTLTASPFTNAIELAKVESTLRTRPVVHGRWVRITVYMDMSAAVPNAHLWIDEDLTDDSPGVYKDDGRNGKLAVCAGQGFTRAHWGVYADQDVPGGRQLEDAYQIWTLDRPLEMTAQSAPPQSPFERLINPDFRDPRSN